MLELTRRYVINFYNAFDRQTEQLKRGKLDRDMYLSEVESIAHQLDELVSNVYFGRLVVKYPRISLLLILIHREVVELGKREVLEALRPDTLADLYGMQKVVRKDLPPSLTRSEPDRLFDEIVALLVKGGAIPGR